MALSVVANLLLLIGALLALFVEDWRIGLLLAFFVLLTMVLLGRYREVALPHWQAGRQASAQLFAFIGERLGGIDDIRANGAADYNMRRFYELERTYFHTRRKATFTSHLLTTGLNLVLVLGTTIGLGLAAYLLLEGTFTIGGVYLVTHYAAFLGQPISALVFKADDLQKAGASIARIRELQTTSSEIVDGHLAWSPTRPFAVELRSLSFAYGKNDQVLKDVDLHLTSGRVLGLLGRTGSGKTTLTRLLLRFYDPLEGAVFVDGVDLRDVKIQDLRRAVGMVTQDVQLFHASVRDNLGFFAAGISDKRIKETLYELGLGNWFESLPEGLDTVLAPNGADLSAGEAQLLAFARVFLKDPQFVILDEASSRLDPQTEAHIEKAIDHLLEGRTALLVAHRLQSLDRANDIAILEGGHLIEKGEAHHLRQDPDSRFARLLRQGIEEHLA